MPYRFLFSPVSKLMLAAMLCAMLAVSLGACGKRGEPYRPSEIPQNGEAPRP